MGVAGTDDAMLPMLISRGSLPVPPSNGEAVLVRTPSAGGSGRSGRSGLLGVVDLDDDVELAPPPAPLPLPPPLPEMRDMECQTRESLFHNHSSSLSNHEPSLASRSNSERSCTPPPPPPPTISRLVNMKNGRNAPRAAPFSTFGYVDDGLGGHGQTLSRRGPPPAPGPMGPPLGHHHHHHHHHHEDPMRFRAEAVIEMDQKSSGSSSAGGSGGGGGGGGAGPGPERPFSMDSTKSAPDVIVTH